MLRESIYGSRTRSTFINLEFVDKLGYIEMILVKIYMIVDI